MPPSSLDSTKRQQKFGPFKRSTPPPGHRGERRLFRTGKTPPTTTTTPKGDCCCYYCGSLDHPLQLCKDYKQRQKDLLLLSMKNSPIPDIRLPFAHCFICKQQGHLQGLCPENPKGLYPKGGGCRFCGSVRHFALDCPLGLGSQKKSLLSKREQDVGLSTIGKLDSSQGGDDDDVCLALFKASKEKAFEGRADGARIQSTKKVPKMVQFMH